jgi:hypothetical protein
MFDPLYSTILAHFLKYHFIPGYTRWTHHGEVQDIVDVKGVADEEETKKLRNKEASERD